MQWKIIDGWHCVTIGGLMSWKFRSLREAVLWAFVMKEVREFEASWGEQK